ncbi:hypothetical protein [Actinokineospora sp. NBRC 105648]|uniref:hypothetical protein n=1 Tax=Actinokineospora sp. NBRC 105648 TaxID=3032206 RepID=UPI0024A1F376|nr:hypothetical protein [Actinokineospora sp. NBRC 105648]GLZ36885.1 hypothetical protein Acsp05_05100 [Actinokineospora sp. NBRC 105648]
MPELTARPTRGRQTAARRALLVGAERWEIRMGITAPAEFRVTGVAPGTGPVRAG